MSICIYPRYLVKNRVERAKADKMSNSYDPEQRQFDMKRHKMA